MSMSNTADFAQDFIARARTGNRVSVSLKRSHMEGFLKVLARHSVAVADICLSQLDPELRQIVLTLFFSTAAGAAVGASVGGRIGGPSGAAVGAMVGGAAGLAIGVVALTIHVAQRGDRIVVTAN
jgi:hypothetical protein